MVRSPPPQGAKHHYGHRFADAEPMSTRLHYEVKWQAPETAMEIAERDWPCQHREVRQETMYSLRAIALMCLAAGTIATAQVRAAGAPANFDAEAIRVNNRGVAQMGQQFTDRAAVTFADAMKKNPTLAQAAINEGIALLTLQRLDDAKKALKTALALDSKSPQAWYNLGLAQHAGNESEEALKSFQKAVELDPRDGDSYYFLGACYSELKEYDKAIAVFKQALEIDPNHASSEFQMARAMQRSGDVDHAKEHFKRFQHLTSAKIGAPIGLAYGEQGRYSIVTPVAEPQAMQKAMIPVKMVAQDIGSQVSESTPGAPRLNGRPRAAPA